MLQKRDKAELALIISMFFIGMLFNHYFELLMNKKDEPTLKADSIRLPTDHNIKLVWNGKDNEIPQDGTLVRLQYTKENTVYVGLADLTDTDCSYINTTPKKP